MEVNIFIEDLVGNAFIPYLERTEKRTLSLKKIEDFGRKVVSSLNEEGIRAYLIFSRDLTSEFFDNYSEYFTLDEENNTVSLQEEISKEKLIEKFSGYVSLEVLVAYRKEENIKELLKE